MKKIFIISLLSVFLLGMISSSCYVAKPRYRNNRPSYRTHRVYIVNRAYRTLRGRVNYIRNNRSYMRRFRIRPGRDIIIRADRHSRVRVRYEGRRVNRTIRRGGQRINLH